MTSRLVELIWSLTTGMTRCSHRARPALRRVCNRVATDMNMKLATGVKIADGYTAGLRVTFMGAMTAGAEPRDILADAQTRCCHSFHIALGPHDYDY